MLTRRWSVLPSLLLVAAAAAQGDPDGDGDGLSDFAERHKYLTDPAKKDSDGDGVPDGDWRERREYQYTVRVVVQVMRPVTPEYLSDDHQDVRVLDETDQYVELEVFLYPFTTVATAIEPDAKWRQNTAAMKRWTAPGPTADWSPALRAELMAALAKDGIDAGRLDDKTLVERGSRWLCAHAKNHDAFTAFVTAFDDKGKPYLPDELKAAVPADAKVLADHWEKDISASGMFRHGLRGSCSSSSIYLNGCLRALGIPTRIVLCIPIVDANDQQELRLLDRGLTHRALHAQTTKAIGALAGQWASHSFNEVFVGGRWRRLNYERLGQDIREPGMFGLMIHVATFSDWADARMHETIGRRQTLRAYDDVFGFANPYSTIALRDESGPHCRLAKDGPVPVAGRITGVTWGDGADAPEDVREWFTKHKVFGLVARIEGPADNETMTRLLNDADLRVLLVTDGKPQLGVGFDARNYWGRRDHWDVVVPFGAADRRDHAADCEYRVVPRNDRKDATWSVGPGVLVPRR